MNIFASLTMALGRFVVAAGVSVVPDAIVDPPEEANPITVPVNRQLGPVPPSAYVLSGKPIPKSALRVSS